MGQSTILKIQAVLVEKIERKVCVNEDESLTDLQILIKYEFLLDFLHESEFFGGNLKRQP